MTDTTLKAYLDALPSAESDLLESNKLLEDLFNNLKQSEPFTFDDMDNLRTMQLMLQYRLDTQNTLSQLSKLQSNLLQYLGVDPIHSKDLNTERLAYALGSNDLQLMLTLLNQLIDALLRILSQMLTKKVQRQKEIQEHQKKLKNIKRLTKIITLQKPIAKLIANINKEVDAVAGTPHYGIVLDYIVSIQGPISRFYQALIHGIGLSSELFHFLQLDKNAQPQLTKLLHDSQTLKYSAPSAKEQQRMFHPEPPTPHHSETLEQRAAQKRLSPFFWHK